MQEICRTKFHFRVSVFIFINFIQLLNTINLSKKENRSLHYVQQQKKKCYGSSFKCPYVPFIYFVVNTLDCDIHLNCYLCYANDTMICATMYLLYVYVYLRLTPFFDEIDYMNPFVTDSQ